MKMEKLRTGMAIGVAVLLAGGYAASQWAALTGQAPQYAAAVDRTPVAAVSLAVLLAAVAFAVFRERGAKG